MTRCLEPYALMYLNYSYQLLGREICYMYSPKEVQRSVVSNE